MTHYFNSAQKIVVSLRFGIIISSDNKKISLPSVVTGSTDGIGKAYAFELGRLRFSIVLISRTQSKLDAVMEELKKECGVEVFVLFISFLRNYLCCVLILLLYFHSRKYDL